MSSSTRPQLLLIILCAFLGIGLVTFLWGAINVFSKPIELIWGEGHLWDLADKFSNREPLYRAVGADQYHTLPYPPVFPLITGCATWIFGRSV